MLRRDRWRCPSARIIEPWGSDRYSFFLRMRSPRAPSAAASYSARSLADLRRAGGSEGLCGVFPLLWAARLDPELPPFRPGEARGRRDGPSAARRDILPCSARGAAGGRVVVFRRPGTAERGAERVPQANRVNGRTNRGSGQDSGPWLASTAAFSNRHVCPLTGQKINVTVLAKIAEIVANHPV